MERNGFRYLPANTVQRIEARHRLLENHPGKFAAHSAEHRVPLADDRFLVEQNPAAGISAAGWQKLLGSGTVVSFAAVKGDRLYAQFSDNSLHEFDGTRLFFNGFKLAGAGAGISSVFGAFLVALSRNPGIAGMLFRYALLGFVLTEAIALFGLMMAFLILFAF